MKLQNGDVLHLLETSLPADILNDDITIDGYRGRFINIRNGKGISTFIRNDIVSKQSQTVVKETLQIAKFVVGGIDSISVYRSSTHSIKELCGALENLVEEGKPTIISGDFNICSKKNGNNVVTSRLLEKGFKMMIQRPTHIQGGYIDHMYWLDRDDRYEVNVEFYSPYWTDHDGLLMTITERY